MAEYIRHPSVFAKRLTLTDRRLLSVRGDRDQTRALLQFTIPAETYWVLLQSRWKTARFVSDENFTLISNWILSTRWNSLNFPELVLWSVRNFSIFDTFCLSPKLSFSSVFFLYLFSPFLFILSLSSLLSVTFRNCHSGRNATFVDTVLFCVTGGDVRQYYMPP